MAIADLLKEIDAEISKLEQARALLSEGSVAPGRGRPKGSKNAPAKKAKRGGISPEGRKRIADAMKRRWAERRKAAK
jgi:hypothetical protein